MSRENVEVVQAAYEAWNRGDLDGALRRAHPDIEFVQDSRIPGAVNLAGRSALRAWLDSFHETWEWFRINPERVDAVGEDRILIVATISAKGRLSQAEVHQRVGHVLTIHDGQMVRWNSYADAADALEAVGLRE
jgi:ketosteroid isomerase-like protein